MALLLVALLALGPPSAHAAQEPPETVVTVDVRGAAGALVGDLQGFNWRIGGEAVADLHPSLIRVWSVDFSKITAEPGVYDWSLPDAQIASIRAMGATPLIVLVGRPSWSPDAGSAGYEEAVRAAMQRYAIAGPAPWFESGNEPEFPPTSHGQLLHDVPLDAAAQARAVLAVEQQGGHLRWGGPGALFADLVTLELFAASGAAAGRTPDYLSWHSYTNQPLLGPDGSEFSDPASAAAYEALKGSNPAASPSIIGLSTDVVKVIASGFTAPDGAPPDAVLTEWNLSSGGLDLRNDTNVGAAHTLASLVELQTHGADASTFFASVDRHCPQPADAPDPMCGDWGTASADGVRKPVWWAFSWWHRMAGTVVPVTGSTPEDGFWALATSDGSTLRVVLASFSAADPKARTVRIDGLDGTGSGTIEHLQAGGSAPPTSSPFDGVVALAPNDAVLVEIPLAGRGTTTVPVTTTAPVAASQLPVTGGATAVTGAALVGSAALLALALLRRGRLTSWP
jgi:hypothetical protein